MQKLKLSHETDPKARKIIYTAWLILKVINQKASHANHLLDSFNILYKT